MTVRVLRKRGPASANRLQRVVDVLLASSGLVLAAPLLAIAAAGIKLSSPGPVLYRAKRIGRDRRHARAGVASPTDSVERRRQEAGYSGREFVCYKLRTMHVTSSAGSPITARDDSRIFRLGTWLRATKIDELPQLLNVIVGDMSLVGPRPEAPEIVRSHYTLQDLETLQVLPGLTSPGSLHYYEHGETILREEDAVQLYLDKLLPTKLAIDRTYLRRATVVSDLLILVRTIRVVVASSMRLSRLTGRTSRRIHASVNPAGRSGKG